MVNVCLHGMDLEKPTDLIQSHAAPHEHSLWKQLFGLLVENIVLGEGVVGLEFWRPRGFYPERVENHDDGDDAAIVFVLWVTN
jgi:hypothetical protein